MASETVDWQLPQRDRSPVALSAVSTCRSVTWASAANMRKVATHEPIAVSASPSSDEMKHPSTGHNGRSSSLPDNPYFRRASGGSIPGFARRSSGGSIPGFARRPTRSNTVRTYQAPTRSNWQPGAEPGVDTAKDPLGAHALHDVSGKLLPRYKMIRG